MFDRIERVRQSFITRKAEKTSSEQYIHHSNTTISKDKNHADKNNWKDHDDDMADISVESLIIFLEGLKRGQGSQPDEDAIKKPINPMMNEALHAYGSKLKKPEKRFTYIDNDDQTIDSDVVLALIVTLKTLLEGKIYHITLEPAETFLKSIEITVEKLRAV